MNKVDSKTWTIAEAGAALAASGATFVNLFTQGTLEIEIYRPVGVDKQKPHEKDELYVIINGTGTFVHGGQRTRSTRAIRCSCVRAFLIVSRNSVPISRPGYFSTAARRRVD